LSGLNSGGERPNTPVVPMQILAHRALLDGPDAPAENTLASLAAACGEGFDVEFDVNVDGDGRLVLSHDPAPWAAERDAEAFLGEVRADASHALNVKRLDTLEELLAAIDRTGARDGVVLFDLELLGAPRHAVTELAERGYRVAHRVSEREPFAADYARDPRVTTIWLDELDGQWVDEATVAGLRDAGKDVLYVSPDLHRRVSPDVLPAVWERVAGWGVTGICTDYPRKLRDLLEGAR
jgi:glycerophosphoryl diester phosphodiesterase